MKSWNKYSINNIAGLILLIMIILSCENEKPGIDRASKIVARVGSVNLTDEMLDSIGYKDANQYRFRSELLRNWIDQEVLFQAAKEDSVIFRKEYVTIIEQAKKEFAAALYLQNIFEQFEVNSSTADLTNYYELNKEDFNLPADSYVLNIARFNKEISIVKFRDALFEMDWNDALLINNSDLELSEYKKMLYDYELRPASMLKVIKNLLPGEISIIFRPEHNKYMVVQMIRSFRKNEIPDFEFVKNEVKEKFLMNKKRLYYDELMSELHSKYNVEIYKDSL